MDLSHYEVLGVEPTADLETIRLAYRRLARATHPDMGGDPVRFAAVALAWSVLSDPSARAAHDGELGGDAADGWGTEVGLDEPAPKPAAYQAPNQQPPAAPAGPPAPPSTPAPDGRVDDALDDDPNPFTSPPRPLAGADTSALVPYYPSSLGGWLSLGFALFVLVSISAVIARPSLLPVSPDAFVTIVAYGTILVGALGLRSLRRGGRALGVFSFIVLTGVLLVSALAGAVWVTDDGTADRDGLARGVVLAVVAACSAAAVVFVEVRRSRWLRFQRARQRVRDAAAAAQRWNDLLAALHRAPAAELRRAEVVPPGRILAVPGWAVVDPVGITLAVASDRDRGAWIDSVATLAARRRESTTPG